MVFATVYSYKVVCHIRMFNIHSFDFKIHYKQIYIKNKYLITIIYYKIINLYKYEQFHLSARHI